MADCDRCTGDSGMAYTCNYCGGTFCGDHRLPENHSCPGLRVSEREKQHDNSSRFQNWVTHVKDRASSSETSSTPEPLSSDEVTTYGGAKGLDTRSSPDIEPDGSLARDVQPEDAFADTRKSNDKEAVGPAVRQHLVSISGVAIWLVVTTLTWLVGVMATLSRGFVSVGSRLVKPAFVLIVVAGLGIAFGPLSATVLVPGPAGHQIDSTLNHGGEVIAGAINQTMANASDADEVSAKRVAYWVHVYVNSERSARGLANLSRGASLREMARYHSKQMAKQGYFAHTSPGGETMEDRYRRFAPSCLRSVGGAENIAYTYVGQQVRTDGGKTVVHDTAREVARGIVRQWMHSAGHRRNILRKRWRAEGVGIAIVDTAEGTRVYATQNFC